MQLNQIKASDSTLISDYINTHILSYIGGGHFGQENNNIPISKMTESIINSYYILEYSWLTEFNIETNRIPILGEYIIQRILRNSNAILVSYNNLGIIEDLLPSLKKTRNLTDTSTNIYNSTKSTTNEKTKTARESLDYGRTINDTTTNLGTTTTSGSNKNVSETSVITTDDDIYKITNPTNKSNSINEDTVTDDSTLTKTASIQDLHTKTNSDSEKDSGRESTNDNTTVTNNYIGDNFIYSPEVFKEFLEVIGTADLYSIVRRSIDYFVDETNRVIF